MRRLPMRRRGFTLIEIMVSLVVLGIIGGALVRLILTQTRFTETQMAKRNARTASRNSMNIMLTDLRMVQDNGGLVGANSDSITVRVPLAFGLFCGRVSGVSWISLLPADSAMTALAYYAGYAIRDSVAGTYAYTPANPPAAFNSYVAPLGALTATAPCAVAGVSTVTYMGQAGKVVQLNEAPTGAPQVGWPAFVYQVITYRFEPSKAFIGRVGLFRKVQSTNSVNNQSSDEIIAPFDTSAKFRYYVLNADTAQSAVPAVLDQVRGLQLYLAGSSSRTPQNSSSATQAALVSGVFFKNRRDP